MAGSLNLPSIMLGSCFLSCLLAVVAPIITVANADGRVFVVSPKGDDANPGSTLQPFRSLEKAARTAGPGDTVFVRAGRYTAGTTIFRSGARQAPVVFRNFPGERPLIHGEGRNPTGLVLENVDYVTVRGFEVRGVGAVRSELGKVPAWGGILLKNTRYSTVEANIIATGDASDRPDGWMGATGIQLWSLSPSKGCMQNRIRGNNVSRGWSGAHTLGPALGNVFEGNNFHHNQESYEDSDGAGQDNSARKFDWIKDKTTFNPRENVYRYNTFSNNADDGLDMWVSVANRVEYNRSFENGLGKQGDGNGFKMGPGGSNLIRYNLAWMNRAKAFDDNRGLMNRWEKNLAFGNGSVGSGGDSATTVQTTAAWQEHKLRQKVQYKIENYQSSLFEKIPPKPPTDLKLAGNHLSWVKSEPASDGDLAAYYLVFQGREIVGLTRYTSFQLPPNRNGLIRVCAMDDSFQDNMSECQSLVD